MCDRGARELDEMVWRLEIWKLTIWPIKALNNTHSQHTLSSICPVMWVMRAYLQGASGQRSTLIWETAELPTPRANGMSSKG